MTRPGPDHGRVPRWRSDAARLLLALAVVAGLSPALAPVVAPVARAAQPDISVSAAPDRLTGPGPTTVTATVPFPADPGGSDPGGSDPGGSGPSDGDVELRSSSAPPVTFSLFDAAGGDAVSSATAREPSATGNTAWTYRTSLRVPDQGKWEVQAAAPGWNVGRASVVVRAEPPQLTLTQDSTRSPLGTAVAFTVRVTGGTGSGTLRVTATHAPSDGALLDEQVTSGAPFSRTVSYGGTQAGRELITASWSEPNESGDSMEVVHSWTPPPAGVAVTVAPDGSTLVGTAVTVTVTVTGSVGDTALDLSVAGPNGRTLDYTGGPLTFTASYRGSVPGVDTVRAKWRDDGGPVEASAIHEWRGPGISLSGSGGSLDLGTIATLSLDLPDGDFDATPGVVVTGPNEGADLTLTGGGSSYTVTYQGRRAGRDEVTATLTVGDRNYTATAEQDWNTPIVVLEQDTELSVVGGRTTVTARATGTAAGSIDFTLAGVNQGAVLEVDGGFPVGSVSWTGSTAGADELTASVTAFDQRYGSEGLAHEWVTPTLVLSQDTEVSQPGADTVLTATVEPSGVAGTVTFTVDGPEGTRTLADDGADGPWTAAYSRTGEGEDTITARLSTAGGTEVVSGELHHRWDGDAPPAVVLSPAGTTSCTGSPFSPTVTVTDSGRPLSGVPVTVQPGSGGAPLAATTDGDGHATVTYQVTDPGQESVTATAQVDGTPLESAPQPHAWEACEITVGLAPAGTTSTVGSTFAPTVTVRDAEGRPVPDAAVALRVTRDDDDPAEPDPAVEQSLTTGPSGTATGSVTRDGSGEDRLEAVVTSAGRTGRATVDHFWADGAGLRVSVRPAGATTTTGSPFTATVLVTTDQLPVPGARVRVTAGLPGQPDATPDPVTTGADGQASVTYSRDVAGDETVTAEVTDGDRTGRAAVAHSWADAGGLRVSLEPAGTSTVLDTDFTVTATVTDDDDPVTTTDVAFTAAMDGQPDATGSGRTGEDGRVSFTYRRDFLGPDTVTVAVTLPDGRHGEAAVAHLWRGADPRGPVEEPPVRAGIEAQGIPVPGGLITLAGTGCPAGATVTLLVDGEPVGTTTAGPAGSYARQVRLADLAVGAHDLVGECRPVRARGTVHVVVPTAASGTAAAGVATAAAVLSFFVLLGGQLVRLTGGQVTPGT